MGGQVNQGGDPTDPSEPVEIEIGGELNLEDLEQGTDTNETDVQTNLLSDTDLVGVNGNGDISPVLAFNDVGSLVTQLVESDGGTGTSSDGIQAALGNASAGDDYSASGAASASADATSVGDVLEQEIETGANGQSNELFKDIVGSDENILDVGGDYADTADGTDSSATGPTETFLDISQDNSLNDVDTVYADVYNAGTIDQDVIALGADADSGWGINYFDTQSSSITAGDNIDISGSSSASADAIAIGEAIDQDIDTGANIQQNVIGTTIVGADRNIASVGDDNLTAGLGVVSTGAGSAVTSYGADDNPITQTNEANDADLVELAVPVADLAYTADVSTDQLVSATGGTATAEGGIRIHSDGTTLTATADSVSVDGLGEASADATAFGGVITQTVDTGANAQVNGLESDIVGGNQNIDAIGDSGIVSNPLGVRDGTEADLTDTLTTFHVDQFNGGDADSDPAGPMNDKDDIVNQDFVNGGIVIQDVSATGGFADPSGIDMAGVLSIVAGDDASVSGTATATTDATAQGLATTQALNSGDNVQGNSFDSSIVGVDENITTVGGDASGDDADLAATSGNAVTVTDFDLTQANALDDQDDLLDPTVWNVGQIDQDVTADGGVSVADWGINNMQASVTAGDNIDISGSAAASADATAFAEAITQDADTGSNVQSNSIVSSIVGADRNVATVGDDNTFENLGEATTGNGAAITSYGYIDTDDSGNDIPVPIDQSNSANDSDNIVNADVLNEDLASVGLHPVAQTVTATGGDADTGGGINLQNNAGVSLDAGDSISVDGSGSASADATAVGSAVTQDIDTGANLQMNALDSAVVGGNQNIAMTGDTGLIADPLETRDTDGNSDTATSFLVEQDNLLTDDDNVGVDVASAANVTNLGSVDQDVTADGGNAGQGTAPYGIDLESDLTIVFAGDDASISGSASASADAIASGSLVTQDLTAGGNGQSNDFDSSIVGVDQNLTSVGGDSLGGSDGFGAYSDPNPITPEGTDQQYDLLQINDLTDQDVVAAATVSNSGDGMATGVLDQYVAATGGFATSEDGIGGGSSILATNVDDDLDISGSTSASADASAFGSLLTQNISMGANFQTNSIGVDIVGGSQTIVEIGEDGLV